MMGCFSVRSHFTLRLKVLLISNYFYGFNETGKMQAVTVPIYHLVIIELGGNVVR